MDRRPVSSEHEMARLLSALAGQDCNEGGRRGSRKLRRQVHLGLAPPKRLRAWRIAVEHVPPQRIYERLHGRSKATGRPVEELVTEALDEYLTD